MREIMEITEEQRKKIVKILNNTCYHFPNDVFDGVFIDDWITWDEIVMISEILKDA